MSNDVVVVAVQQPAPVVVAVEPLKTVVVSVEPLKTVVNTVVVVGAQGTRGLPGAVGDTGAPGPVYTGDELPSFTLIFENQLV